VTPDQLIESFPPADAERAGYLLADLSWIQHQRQLPTEFLDMGAGSGSMSAVVMAMFPGIHSCLVDVVSRLIYLDHLTEEERARVEVLDGPNNEALEGRQFDLVLTMDVLEHIADWRSAIDRLTGMVRPGGFLYV